MPRDEVAPHVAGKMAVGIINKVSEVHRLTESEKKSRFLVALGANWSRKMVPIARVRKGKPRL